MDEKRELLVHRWVTGAFATPEEQKQELDQLQRYIAG